MIGTIFIFLSILHSRKLKLLLETILIIQLRWRIEINWPQIKSSGNNSRMKNNEQDINQKLLYLSLWNSQINLHILYYLFFLLKRDEWSWPFLEYINILQALSKDAYRKTFFLHSKFRDFFLDLLIVYSFINHLQKNIIKVDLKLNLFFSMKVLVCKYLASLHVR